jgi:hypothetical protein
MKRLVVVVVLIATGALGSVAGSIAGERFSGPVQHMEGRIKAIDFACHEAQSVCEGTIVVAEQRQGDVALALRPGTQIRRGERFLTPGQLEPGTPIKAFAFQMSAEPLPRVVLIEVTDARQPLTAP